MAALMAQFEKLEEKTRQTETPKGPGFRSRADSSLNVLLHYKWLSLLASDSTSKPPGSPLASKPVPFPSLTPRASANAPSTPAQAKTVSFTAESPSSSMQTPK